MGFFIITLDFIGYTGTVAVLVVKEFFSPDINWLDFYNLMAGCAGLVCSVAFVLAAAYIVSRYRKECRLPDTYRPLRDAGANSVPRGLAADVV